MKNLKKLNFAKGMTIFREGEEGNCAFVLLSGEVRVHKQKGDESITLAHLGADQVFGEMALISPGPRTASITVEQDCEVLLLDQSQFARRVSELDPVMEMVFEVVIARFRNTLGNLGRAEARLETRVTPERMKKAIAQLHLEADIQQAIGAREFELYYQPIVCLATGKLAGFEGLMRWNHPELGLVPPSTFIPVAESGNLINRLTRLAIDQASTDLREIGLCALSNPAGVKAPFIAVNISGRDLEKDNFCSFVESRIAEHGLTRGMLKLEVTESSLMQDMEACCDRLHRLRDAGVEIAIDDFGTGYSNMSYLSKMPISTLKIDRSFVMEMLDNAQTMQVTNGILRLAEELGLNVVAEGIEEWEHAAYLASKSCTYGQGYHYARPMPRTELYDLIREWAPTTLGNMSGHQEVQYQAKTQYPIGKPLMLRRL